MLTSIIKGEKVEMVPSSTASTIPIIDLQEFPGQSKKLIEACEEWGCFRLINHHRMLPPSLTSEMKLVVRSLLDLPVEIKARNTDVIPGSGYKAPSQVEPHHEALGLYDISSTEAVDAFCAQLDASPQQRETIKMYAKAVHEIMMDITHKLAEGLGLVGISFEEWPCLSKMNKYNFSPDTLGSSGLQLHTDSGFITILEDDENVGGLEVMDNSGKFVAVEPFPGTLLVNLGDIAHVWSNGRFCNVKHRVQCKEAAVRVSIASSLMGPKGVPVEPPPELVDDSEHGRLYAPITFDDYRKLRLSKKLHAGEALALVRRTDS